MYFISERREVHGEVLDLIRISRTEMGAYLCIAQNGVPPSISKRIILTVECKWQFQVALTPPLSVTVMVGNDIWQPHLYSTVFYTRK